MQVIKVTCGLYGSVSFWASSFPSLQFRRGVWVPESWLRSLAVYLSLLKHISRCFPSMMRIPVWCQLPFKVGYFLDQEPYFWSSGGWVSYDDYFLWFFCSDSRCFYTPGDAVMGFRIGRTDWSARLATSTHFLLFSMCVTESGWFVCLTSSVLSLGCLTLYRLARNSDRCIVVSILLLTGHV